jgi:hypothetical protein
VDLGPLDGDLREVKCEQAMRRVVANLAVHNTQAREALYHQPRTSVLANRAIDEGDL